jgi:hypothetical protein
VENYLERLRAIWGAESNDSTGALSWIRGSIENQATEGVYLDFKQKSDRREAGLNNDDRANLAKAISGFANTDGGLIVWGVKAKADTKEDPDVAIELCPVSHLKTFQTQLNHACGDAVTPPVAGVESRAVPEAPNADSGYVVTIVPKRRDTLIQANAKTCKGFYIRVGSGFYQLPEPLIAEFYRSRPAAILRLVVHLARAGEARFEEELVSAEREDSLGRPYGTCTYRQSVAIAWNASLNNDGAGSAAEVVVHLGVSERCLWNVIDYGVRRHDYHDGSTMIPVFEPIPEASFKGVKGDRGAGRLLQPLHPGQATVVAQGDLLIPFEAFRSREVRDFEISGHAYAKDAPPYSLRWQVAGSEVVARYFEEFEPIASAALPASRVVPKLPTRMIEI